MATLLGNLESFSADVSARSGHARAFRGVLRNGVPMLMYHSVAGPDDAKNSCIRLAGMSVTADAFAAHMSFVSQYYNSITLADYVNWRRGRTSLPPRPCVVTFDDGFADVYLNAVPILRKLNMTATFFIIGQVVSKGQPPWLHALYDLLDSYQVTDCVKALQRTLGSISLAHDEKPVPKSQLVSWVRRYVKTLDVEGRRRFVQTIRGHFGTDYQLSHRFMTRQQVRELKTAGFEIGCHSYGHEYMSGLTGSELTEDIEMGKAAVSEASDSEVRSFCYPFGGVRSWSDATGRALKAGGFDCACTTLEGLNGRHRDLFQLRRVRIEGDLSVPVLQFRMLGMRSLIWDVWLGIHRTQRFLRETH